MVTLSKMFQCALLLFSLLLTFIRIRNEVDGFVLSSKVIAWFQHTSTTTSTTSNSFTSINKSTRNFILYEQKKQIESDNNDNDDKSTFEDALSDLFKIGNFPSPKGNKQYVPSKYKSYAAFEEEEEEENNLFGPIDYDSQVAFKSNQESIANANNIPLPDPYSSTTSPMQQIYNNNNNEVDYEALRQAQEFLLKDESSTLGSLHHSPSTLSSDQNRIDAEQRLRDAQRKISSRSGDEFVKNKDKVDEQYRKIFQNESDFLKAKEEANKRKEEEENNISKSQIPEELPSSSPKPIKSNEMTIISQRPVKQSDDPSQINSNTQKKGSSGKLVCQKCKCILNQMEIAHSKVSNKLICQNCHAETLITRNASPFNVANKVAYKYNRNTFYKDAGDLYPPWEQSSSQFYTRKKSTMVRPKRSLPITKKNSNVTIKKQLSTQNIESSPLRNEQRIQTEGSTQKTTNFKSTESKEQPEKGIVQELKGNARILEERRQERLLQQQKRLQRKNAPQQQQQQPKPQPQQLGQSENETYPTISKKSSDKDQMNLRYKSQIKQLNSHLKQSMQMLSKERKQREQAEAKLQEAENTISKLRELLKNQRSAKSSNVESKSETFKSSKRRPTKGNDSDENDFSDIPF